MWSLYVQQLYCPINETIRLGAVLKFVLQFRTAVVCRMYSAPGHELRTQNKKTRSTDLRFYVSTTRHRMGHFGDVLPSQSLDLALKKLNLT